MRTAKSNLFPKTLFYFFKMFGVAPISFRSGSVAPFTSSRLGLSYNFLLSCPVIGFSYFCLKHALYEEYAGRIAFEKIVDTMQTSLTIFTTLFVLAVFCIYQERFVQLANRLYEIYQLSISMTTNMGHDVDIETSMLYTSVKRIILVNLVTAILWFITIFLNVRDFFYYFFIMTLNNLIILCILLQYSLVLKLLHHLYRWLNADLTSLLKTVNFSSLQKASKTTSRLYQLREIHVSLSHVSQNVSCFYSIPMFVCVADVFLTLMIYGYYMVRSVVIWDSKIPIAVIIHCAMVVVMILEFTMILARAAGITVRESKATGEIVSESIASCQDKRVAKQLKEFSIYLLHKNVGFCIFHLFPLNETLVVSVISSITTYLVILVQFKESRQV